MKKSIIAGLMGMATLCAGATDLFFYSPENGEGGLRIAVKESNGGWRSIGNGFDFVKSDFGPWGSHKKMWQPELFPTSDGGWALLFRADEKGEVIGMARSKDLLSWKPQKYYLPSDTAKLTFRTNVGFHPTEIELDGKRIKGNVMRSDNETVNRLDNYVAERARLGKLYSEHCDGDKERFADLKPLKASVITNGTSKAISPLLMGIFFEDINYAADVGLYGELIQNRDFEYDPSENGREGWGPAYAWSVNGDKIDFTIATDDPIHPNNPITPVLT